jgi:hypothetical protein
MLHVHSLRYPVKLEAPMRSKITRIATGVTIGIAGLVVAGLVAMSDVSTGHPSASPESVIPVELVSSKSDSPGHSFSVLQANMSNGLAPGVGVPLNLQVFNSNNQDINVTSLTGTAAASDHSGSSFVPACTASYLHITTPSTTTFPFLIKAGATKAVTLTATLDSSAPTTCQSATFTISYTAQGVQA